MDYGICEGCLSAFFDGPDEGFERFIGPCCCYHQDPMVNGC